MDGECGELTVRCGRSRNRQVGDSETGMSLREVMKV